jgi:SAM-dependent methyltransferase
MANFRPLKDYMFYCLDRCIEQYGLCEPFLEIGCGRGDVSAHLARKGWAGLAIDYSDAAIGQAKQNLKQFPKVEVRSQSLAETTGLYNTIILWDVLEHFEDDRATLTSIEKLLNPGGQLFIAVPSNPGEWRWDDDFYGHFRRYTVTDLSEKLTDAGMEPRLFWDFTYPVFWIMRRIYTRIKPRTSVADDRQSSTKASSTVNAWDLPLFSKLLDCTAIFWYPLHRIQFRFFRNATSRGHEFFALARKLSFSEEHEKKK